MKKSFFVVFCGALVVFFFWVHSEAFSYQGGILLEPVKIEADVFPGRSVTKDITITNQNPFGVTIEPELMDFKVGEDNKIHWYVGSISDPLRSSTWLKTDFKTFVLEPEQSKKVEIEVSIPENSEPGGRYATLFFNSRPEDSSKDQNTVKVGTLVVINVPGQVNKSGKIVNVAAPLFSTGGPLDFLIKFVNTGQTHYSTKASIKINNLFWEVANISSEQKFLYPEVSRDINVKWNSASLFGIYTAYISVPDGQGTVHVIKKHFIGASYRYLALIFLVALALVIFRKKIFIKKNLA